MRTAAPIGVCLRWTTFDRDRPDPRFAGISPADDAALEIALRLAAARHAEVLAVTVGPPDGRAALARAVAAGARRAVHVRVAEAIPSALSAHLLAAHLGECALIVTGDASLDRGSGSTPAFLAHELGAEQVLGVIELRIDHSGAATAIRRLDGGAREVVQVGEPAVISVEASAASLRRAALPATLRPAEPSITVVDGPRQLSHVEPPTVPYRPRSKVVAAPAGDDPLARLNQLLRPSSDSDRRTDVIELGPVDAARRIVAQLRQWGYLEHGGG